MVPITEEERNGPLYKYFMRDMVEPDPAKYAQTQDPVDFPEEESALHLDNLFEPGYMPIELGYGYLPDGCAILANLTEFPGATVEMFDFWFAWHPIESMRYKIWNRDQHYYCQTMNPEIALDKSLSLRERLWNTTHDIEEDCNMGKQPLKIKFCNPADIGFSKEKLAKFDGTIVCSAAGNMVHFFRPTANGCELRTRFFFGYKCENGKMVKALPDGMKFPTLAPVKALLHHNIKEFTNLAAILPEVYAEFYDDFVK
jgi:hypothetical protein